MGRVIDITEKMGFAGDPVLKIRDIQVAVRADAMTMLKLISLFEGQSEAAAIGDAYELLFSAEDREKINGLHLDFADFKTLISAAMSAIQGDMTGETQTHTTA